MLSNDFYIDDLLSGTSTIEDTKKVQQEISSLLQTAGFTLRKWASNHSTYLDNIPRELLETQQILLLDNEDGVTILGLLLNQKMINFKSRTTLHRCNQQNHQSNFILQKIHKQLQISQSQQEINYPPHTRFEQALTCRVKMVQLISYVEVMRNLMEQQEVSARISLKTLHPFISKEGLLRVGAI